MEPLMEAENSYLMVFITISSGVPEKRIIPAPEA
jgi:hypothetical protein